MATGYDWDVEEVDDYGDIIDHDFRDRLADFHDLFTQINGVEYRLVLIMDVGNDEEGILVRTWAYAYWDKIADKWKMPPAFDNGNQVPARFHKELERAQLI